MEIDEANLTSCLQRWRKAIEALEEVEDELFEEGWVIYTGKALEGRRIGVPLEVWKKLGLKVNDRVLVPLYRLSRKGGK